MMRALFVTILLLALSGCVSKKAHLKTDGSPGDDDKELAIELFKQGAALLYNDDAAALKKFDEARETDTTLIAAYFNAGVALESLGRREDAQARYEACLTRDKMQAPCLDNWLLVAASLDRSDEARARAELYRTEFPDEPFALVASAKLYLALNDLETAERYGRAAIERDADNAEALLVMARIFYERKQYAAAKWVLKNALEIAPSHGGLHLLLAHTEIALEQTHDAIESFARAVALQPTEDALETYGLLLLNNGRVEEALTVLQRLSLMRPNDAHNFLHLGNAYFANKMFDEAKAAYEMVQQKAPDDVDVNFNLAQLYFDMKPAGLAEIDRLKTAKSYFEAYAQKPGLSKQRQAELKEYLAAVEQKIELEEYAIESAKQAPAEEDAPVDEGVQEEAPADDAVDDE